MKVVFNGVVVTASFSIVDGDNDIVQSIMVQPTQDGKPDPLRFSKLTDENFSSALKALKETRVKIEEDVAKQVADAESKV